MRIVCISSSLSPQSKSERLGLLCIERLQKRGVDAKFVKLKDKRLPGFDDAAVYESDAYRELYDITARADGLILASPVYNWAVSSELKRYVECVGSTPPDKSRRGPFFDKVVTFVSSAGLPHSYMAFGSFALSMMMDFKCIINPYTVYAHGRDWQEECLSDDCARRIEKAMAVMIELTGLLSKREYSSDWEI